MGTNTLIHKLSVSGEQSGSFGGVEATYQLDVWIDDSNRLLVRLMRNGKSYSTKQFRDCETQHSDSERWLNSEIGYPNPFAGILLEQAWNK